jgi:hypothetical protein
LNYKIYAGFEILEKDLVAGTACQRPTTAQGRVSRPALPPPPRVHGDTMAAQAPPATSRRHCRPPATSAPRVALAAAASTCVPHPYPRVAATPRLSSPSLPLCFPPHEDSHSALCLVMPSSQVPEQLPRTPVLLEWTELHPRAAGPQTNQKAANAELHVSLQVAHHRRPPSKPLWSSRCTLELPRAMSSLSGPKSYVDDPEYHTAASLLW